MFYALWITGYFCEPHVKTLLAIKAINVQQSSPAKATKPFFYHCYSTEKLQWLKQAWDHEK